MADKVLIYRPLGEHPPGTKMGDLLLGKLHDVTAEQADVYALKGFVTMPADARTLKLDALASLYVSGKAALDARLEAAKKQADADAAKVLAAESAEREAATAAKPQIKNPCDECGGESPDGEAYCSESCAAEGISRLPDDSPEPFRRASDKE